MNGTQAANKMIEMILEGRKIEAVKAVRALDTNIYNDYQNGTPTSSVGLLDAKLFVEAIQSYVERMTPDAYEVELSQYKKLREAGFSMAEACRIVEALK